MIKSNLLLFVIVAITFSCVPRSKSIYFSKKNGISEDLIPSAKTAYKIRSRDVLNIIVSSVNPNVSSFFNLKAGGEGNLEGYMVSDSGYIYLPVLDSVSVMGLSVEEVQTKLQKLVRAHVTDATVVVRLANFNVTVLGEVGAPGLIAFEGTELSVIEAIGMAKDISDFGNKKKVTLIRKEGDKHRFISLDLTSRDFMTSEYFYLQPNDVIYVEPLKAKSFRLNVGQISMVLGLSSLLFLILNLTNR